MAPKTTHRRVTFFGKPHHDYGFPPEAFDHTRLPDADEDFTPGEDLAAFANALNAPDPIHSSPDDGSVLMSPTLRSGGSSSFNFEKQPPSPFSGSLRQTASGTQTRHGSQGSLLISAQNDWAPVNEKIPRPGKRRKKRRIALGRSVDESREGYLYALLRWPFLFFTMAWIVGLGMSYMLTRFYVWGYEYFVAWRGKREQLRRKVSISPRTLQVAGFP
jgi:hypothetical protein